MHKILNIFRSSLARTLMFSLLAVGIAVPFAANSHANLINAENEAGGYDIGKNLELNHRGYLEIGLHDCRVRSKRPDRYTGDTLDFGGCVNSKYDAYARNLDSALTQQRWVEVQTRTKYPNAPKPTEIWFDGYSYWEAKQALNRVSAINHENARAAADAYIRQAAETPLHEYNENALGFNWWDPRDFLNKENVETNDDGIVGGNFFEAKTFSCVGHQWGSYFRDKRQCPAYRGYRDRKPHGDGENGGAERADESEDESPVVATAPVRAAPAPAPAPVVVKVAPAPKPTVAPAPKPVAPAPQTARLTGPTEQEAREARLAERLWISRAQKRADLRAAREAAAAQREAAREAYRVNRDARRAAARERRAAMREARRAFRREHGRRPTVNNGFDRAGIYGKYIF